MKMIILFSEKVLRTGTQPGVGGSVVGPCWSLLLKLFHFSKYLLGLRKSENDSNKLSE